MACGCNQTPCTCGGLNAPSVMPVVPCGATPCTCGSCTVSTGCPSLCDLDRRNNVWVEGPVDPVTGQGGICLLDTMEECQVIDVLQRDPQARIDLPKVTSNAYLRNMVATIPMLPTVNEGDELQKEVNQNTIPFYTLFRGQAPFNQ